MKKFPYVLIFIFLLNCINFIHSVEISIEGTSKSAINIACVDMERLFKEYPKVEQSKKEYETLKKEKQSELEEKEKEIKIIQDDIKNLEQEIEKAKITTTQPIEPVVTPISLEISTSTETSSEIVTTSTFTEVEKTTSTEILESQLQEKKNILEEKNKEYEELKEKIKIELKEFEKSKTMTIMADLYKIIKELAEEENISIVVEKGNILYGLPNIDITDKVIERLRGKQ